tara:strand:+ start:35390 stop:35929 length:540 start_codon:yes stop_codon:yes gene_type:complete
MHHTRYRPLGLAASLCTILAFAACSGSTPAAKTPAAPVAQVAPIAKAGPVLGVDHVGLTVSDLEASRDFFVKTLGFEVVGGVESYPSVFLSNGQMRLTLWRAEDPTSATPFDRKANIGLHHLAIGVSSFEALDTLYEAVRDYPGVTMEFAPELNSGGPAKHTIFYEPSGNRIELVHRPN